MKLTTAWIAGMATVAACARSHAVTPLAQLPSSTLSGTRVTAAVQHDDLSGVDGRGLWKRDTFFDQRGLSESRVYHMHGSRF